MYSLLLFSDVITQFCLTTGMSLEVFENSGGFTKIQLKPSLPQVKTDNSVHIADPCRWSQMRPPCQWVDCNLMLSGAPALCWGLMWNPKKFSNFSSFVISFDCRGTHFKEAFLQGRLSGINTLPVRGLGKEPSHLPKLKFLFFRDLGWFLYWPHRQFVFFLPEL